MSFDFDTPIDRRNTNCAKWDMMEHLFGVPSESGLPMWLADMDFLPPPAVNEALRAAVKHGVHGYFGDDSAHKSAIVDWMQFRHGWTVDPDWITTVPGLVAGVALCLQAFTQPGDGVVLLTPVYHAFARVIKANGCKVVECPMPISDGRYRIDLEAAAQHLTGRERVLILCSPHNPGGCVWTRAELRATADFAARHGLIILSDEIHADLVYPGHKHTILALAAPEHVGRIVTLTAATKTFNLAGILTGNVIIQDTTLRQKFLARMVANGVGSNRLAVLMATAAYREGADWLDALILYLDGNRKLLDTGLHTIPGFRSMPLEATYLAWVDLTGTGMTDKETTERMQRTAGIVASPGPSFGPGGAGHIRLNFAMRRQMLQNAVERMQTAFSDRL